MRWGCLQPIRPEIAPKGDILVRRPACGPGRDLGKTGGMANYEGYCVKCREKREFEGNEVELADGLRRRLGYRGGSPVRLALAADHATTLRREADGATVDLHWKLHGMEHLPADAPVWALLTADAEELVVAGRPVPVPGVVARTL